MFEVQVIVFFRDFFVVFNPFMACRHGIEAEMNEHAETVVGEPGGIARSFSCNVACHFPSVLPPFAASADFRAFSDPADSFILGKGCVCGHGKNKLKYGVFDMQIKDNPAAFRIWRDYDLKIVYAGPVSYTHLDVYKRQA